MESINSKEEIGKSLYASHPYCTFYGKFVRKDCWERCCAYCRYREVASDEHRISQGNKPCVGYSHGKWKNMPNFFCIVDLTVVDLPDYIIEEDK